MIQPHRHVKFYIQLNATHKYFSARLDTPLSEAKYYWALTEWAQLDTNDLSSIFELLCQSNVIILLLKNLCSVPK